METNGWLSALRSWFTTLVSLGLSFVLAIGVLFFADAKEEMFVSTSPDQHHKIHFYLTNGGATTSYGVVGELEGPLWFKKVIYNDYKIDRAVAKWRNNYTVNINEKMINLRKGQTYDFSKDPDWDSEYH